MKIDLSQFRQTFLQESAEHVENMESGLLDLRSSPTDVELMNAIFRAAHSIKGGAGSFGLTNLVRFTHAMENLLDKLRSLEMAADDETIGLLIESVDVLRAILEAGDSGEMPEQAPHLVERMEALISGGAGGTAPAAQAAAAPVAGELTAGQKTYRVEFSPDPEMFTSGTNPIVLLRNLESLGTLESCELNADDLPALADLDTQQCYLKWVVELTTASGEAEIREVFEFVEHLAEVRVEETEPARGTGTLALTAGSDNAREQAGPSSGAAPKATPLAATSVHPPPGKGSAARPAQHRPAQVEAQATPVAAKPAAAPAAGEKSAAGERRTEPERRTPPKKPAGDSSIRVATDKVDRLIDLVGELVIAQGMTAQMVESFEPALLPKLREAVAAMERGTRELHERVMAVRMLPVGTLFQRYTRTVYDIAQSTGKKIRLETAGEETEIDKSMLELLGDPLTHLVRNSADHGVEKPEARIAAGKPEQGVIQLRAFHRAGRIVIEITDDGGGIDPARVRAKAIERGLISAEAQMTDEQLRMLIFEPGFSTRDEVSDLSGRGVGMDVVKRNIQQLNGTVGLVSEVGKGSTVSIELPLTLAILEGLLVRVQDRTLVLPLLSVVETVSPRQGQLQRIADQGEVVVIREEQIPVLRLRRFLALQKLTAAEGENQAPADGRLVVVVEAGRQKIGLVIDELLGQQQVVVKSLEKHFHKVEGLMGATILGDGLVAPIVDVGALAQMDLFGPEPGQAIVRVPIAALVAQSAAQTAGQRGAPAAR